MRDMVVIVSERACVEDQSQQTRLAGRLGLVRKLQPFERAAAGLRHSRAPKITGRIRHLLTNFIMSMFACAGVAATGSLSAGAEIQLPPETGAFKQDAGAEIANGQCLICHSVEYVTSQPLMGRAFWKASIVKMQQKYGAPIADGQVEPLVDYLARNYGVSTNASGAATALATSANQASAAATAAATTGHAAASDGPQLAMKYGCLGCHNAQTKIVGPSYHEIATKYQNDAEAFSKIDQQIHKGGSGKWGPIIMPPFPQISPAETRALAEWILALK